jgi:hypothetical protein
VSFRSVAFPWLSGGLIVLGYAAFSRLRARRARRALPEPLRHEPVEPLAARLEHVSDEVALDLEAETLPANSNALGLRDELGAQFLGRASAALSSFHFGGKF